MSIEAMDGSGDRSVRRGTLGSQVAYMLRQDILFGRLKPGTRLAQEQLCKEFGTSRMPVRDALRQLITEGLLVRDGGQHSLVAPLSREGLMDAFEVEGVLHGMAARRAVERSSADDLGQLQSLHDEMVAASTDTPKRTADLNWQFHRQINRLANSRKLIAALKVVSLDIPRDYLVQMPEQIGRSNEQHAALLEAFRRGQPDDADAIMQNHVTEAGHSLISSLERQGLVLE
jgi:DNA-binding GntR family transcriptional regulator